MAVQLSPVRNDKGKVLRYAIQIVTTTPPKRGKFQHMNRDQRRWLVYGHPVRRLLARINEVREGLAELHDPDFIFGKWYPEPLFKNRKYLSGYWSELMRYRDAVLRQLAEV